MTALRAQSVCCKRYPVARLTLKVLRFSFLSQVGESVPRDPHCAPQMCGVSRGHY